MQDSDIPTATIACTWDQMQDLVWKLARRVAADGIPEVVIAIQRGGLIPSVILSHMLGVRSLVSFNIQRTAHDGIAAPKTWPIEGANISFADLDDKDVLVVDDIVGSGVTLEIVQHTLLGSAPRRLRSMACFVNRANWEVEQSRPPADVITYVGKEVSAWVVFPWERYSV